eukprot:gene22948-9331_t
MQETIRCTYDLLSNKRVISYNIPFNAKYAKNNGKRGYE